MRRRSRGRGAAYYVCCVTQDCPKRPTATEAKHTAVTDLLRLHESRESMREGRDEKEVQAESKRMLEEDLGYSARLLTKYLQCTGRLQLRRIVYGRHQPNSVRRERSVTCYWEALKDVPTYHEQVVYRAPRMELQPPPSDPERVHNSAAFKSMRMRQFVISFEAPAESCAASSLVPASAENPGYAAAQVFDEHELECCLDGDSLPNLLGDPHVNIPQLR